VVGLAASVLLAVGVGSFLRSNRTGSVASGEFPTTARGTIPDPSIVAVLPKASSTVAIPPAPAIPPDRNVAELLPPAPPETPNRIEEIPPPRPKGVDVFVAPPLKPIPPLDRLIVRVPFLTAVSDLEREDTRQQLLDELTREPAIRIDLFAKDQARGIEMFQSAAKATGIAVHADALTLDRVKKKQSTAVLVYAESLAAADIRDLMVKISTDDANSKQRVFDSLHATAALPADQAALKDVIGSDPGLWKRPANAEPKPISAGTGDELTKSLTAKTADKPAVLLTFTPAASRTHPAMSKELKEYLAKRGDRKASAVPVLIVIRPPQGG